jgi:glycosyltransferase involved in cell wall biosynthesis
LFPVEMHSTSPEVPYPRRLSRRTQVSIIMPAFNVEPFVGGAIDSVRSQTFEDFELLVVDDGSTDGTAAVVERHERADSRVRLIRQPNHGLSTARNLALAQSTGAYIAILDSDDAWTPSYLASQIEILETRRDVDIVTANAWFLGGAQTGRTAGPTPDPRPDPDLRQLLRDETAVFIMSVFRRRVYEAIGGFDESFRSNEDYDFWIRAAVAGFRFVRNDRPAGYYRRRDDSLSADELRMLKGILRVYEKTRQTILDRPAELAILDAQVERFETELMAAEARRALETGDHAGVKHYVLALHRRRGGAVLGIASMMAKWAPGLLSRAYHAKRVGLYGT